MRVFTPSPNSVPSGRTSPARPPGFSRLRKKADSDVTQDSWASSLIHARRRPTTKRSIQLHLRRAASSTESPAATIAEDGGCGAERAIAALCEAVCQAGPAVDCARETAAGATVAGAVHD